MEPLDPKEINVRISQADDKKNGDTRHDNIIDKCKESDKQILRKRKG